MFNIIQILLCHHGIPNRREELDKDFWVGYGPFRAVVLIMITLYLILAAATHDRNGNLCYRNMDVR